MSPRLEREAAMDDMADYAAQQLQPAVLTLSTPALLAEAHAGLALRVCRQQTTARDVLLVQALTARLQTASIDHARVKVRLSAPDQIELEPRGREALDGMLLLDLPEVA